MIENGMYFAKNEFYELIRNAGGEWNDSKERPLVCCLQSKQYPEIYWAIPVGNWNHRNQAAKNRILEYINRPKDNISSCYYHIGNTTTQSIFFISDVVPITEEYIDREYLNRYTSSIHIIKNAELIKELDRKLRRILAYENSRPNYFRQHITDIVNKLTQNNKNK